jgi:hypothetical protein
MPHEPIAEDEAGIEFKTVADAVSFFSYAMRDPFTREDLKEITKFYLPYVKAADIEEKRLDMLYRELVRGRLILVQVVIVTITRVQKEQCAKLFKLYTGIHTKAFRWNEEAADMLAGMVFQVDECSRRMGVVNAAIPKKPPVKLVPSWRWWLKNFINSLIKEDDLLGKGYVNKKCLEETSNKFTTRIQYELMK